jgi:hypothetical protein
MHHALHIIGWIVGGLIAAGLLFVVVFIIAMLNVDWSK